MMKPFSLFRVGSRQASDSPSGPSLPGATHRTTTNRGSIMETTPQEKVIAIIVDKLGVEEADVIPEASFTNDLGADSLDTVELIMEFETVFNVTIPDEDAEKIVTVGDALNYIGEKSAA